MSKKPIGVIVNLTLGFEYVTPTTGIMPIIAFPMSNSIELLVGSLFKLLSAQKM